MQPEPSVTRLTVVANTRKSSSTLGTNSQELYLIVTAAPWGKWHDYRHLVSELMGHREVHLPAWGHRACEGWKWDSVLSPLDLEARFPGRRLAASLCSGWCDGAPFRKFSHHVRGVIVLVTKVLRSAHAVGLEVLQWLGRSRVPVGSSHSTNANYCQILCIWKAKHTALSPALPSFRHHLSITSTFLLFSFVYYVHLFSVLIGPCQLQ